MQRRLTGVDVRFRPAACSCGGASEPGRDHPPFRRRSRWHEGEDPVSAGFGLAPVFPTAAGWPVAQLGPKEGGNRPFGAGKLQEQRGLQPSVPLCSAGLFLASGTVEDKT